MIHYISIDDETYSINDFRGSAMDRVGEFTRRIDADDIAGFAQYRRKEFVVFAKTAQAMNQIDSNNHVNAKINQMISIISQKPVFIVRRNSQSIISALAHIGAAYAYLGKINEFFPFLQDVLDNHNYVAETSLQEHYGMGYLANQKYTLPASVDPYKYSGDVTSLYREVYYKISDLLSENTCTRHIASMIDTDSFILEQIKVSVPLAQIFFYPCDTIKNVTGLFNFLSKTIKPLNNEEIFRHVFSNNSVCGYNGTFRYTREDVNLFNRDLFSDRRFANHYSKIFVSDIQFFIDVKLDDLDWFQISIQEISDQKDLITKMLSADKYPRQIMTSDLVYELDVHLNSF